MSRIPRPLDEYGQHVLEQLDFLRNSARRYDEGVVAEAKRLATQIRVLVHDSDRSCKSLLGQMGLKEQLRFLDTAQPYDSSNPTSHCGLTEMPLGGGHETKSLPFLDDPPLAPRRVPFADWWHGVVVVDQRKRQFSRRDLVLAVAEQDGGAHVDPGLEPDYAHLTRHDSLGIAWSDATDIWRAVKGVVHASIRQITHELLRTLTAFPLVRAKAPPQTKFMVSGIKLIYADSPVPGPSPQANPTKPVPPGRNSPCPCGSGKKFKVCCLGNNRSTAK